MDPLLLLTDIVPRIKVPKNAELELEIRYNVDERKPGGNRRDKFSPVESVRLLKNIITDHLAKGSSCSIEQSINFVSDENNIKQMIFVNGVQDKSLMSHYEKERIIQPMQVEGSPSYKLTLSFEKKLPEFSVKSCQSARIKLRFSIELDNWRIDITLVKLVQTMSNPQDLKSGKSKMLFKLSVDDFVAKAPWAIANHVELELEYTGDHKLLTPEHIVNAVGEIDKYVDGAKSSSVANADANADVNADVNADLGDTSDYQNKIYEIAKLIKPKQANKFKSRFGLKQLSNQVIEMDKNMFVNKLMPDITNYYITDKVDGKRSVILIDKTGTWAVSNVLERLGDGLPNTYVLDGEFYEESGMYYLFDVLVYKSKNVTYQSFSTRLQLFDDVVTVTKGITGLKVQLKRFIRLTKRFNNQIKELNSKPKPYETDGYVFTPGDGTYDKMVVYKGKPIDKLSVDFLMKKCPQKLLGVRPYMANGKTLYLLFSGISKQVYGKLQMEMLKQYDSIFPHINKYYLPDYFPIQFQPSDMRFAYLYWGDDDKLDGEIGEFVIANPTAPVADYRWKLLRTRDDRKVELARGNYFGNNYKVAEMTWLSYQNPLNFEELDVEDAGYFQESESTVHKESRSFNSFVKSQIFAQFKGTVHVMDIASGKGQDLFRYASHEMKEVLFVEIDKTALMELISRKHDYSKDRKSRGSMHVMTQQLDLNQPYKTNIGKLDDSRIPIPPAGFDLIVCNFALHYLIGSKPAINNIAKFISSYLKPGGRFVFTAFDGQDVVDLIGEDKEWKSDIPGKFHIKSKYTGDIIQPFGQKIDVLLPFSKDAYYTEYLVNIEYLESVFGKLNIILETDQSFSEFLPGYKNANRMDEDDKLYTGLYHYYCFYKNKPKK